MNESFNPSQSDWAKAIAYRLCDEPMTHICAGLRYDIEALDAIKLVCLGAGVSEKNGNIAFVNDYDDYSRIMNDMTEYIVCRPYIIDVFIGTYVIEETYFSD